MTDAFIYDHVRTPRGRDIDAACGQLKTAATFDGEHDFAALLRRGTDGCPGNDILLAQARSAVDAGIDFRSEGRRWARIADAYGGECPVPAGMSP